MYTDVRFYAVGKSMEYQLDDPKSLIENYKTVVDKFVKQLDDRDRHVRYAAAEALGQMQAKEHAPKLAELLKDADPGVFSAAAEALPKLGRQGFPVVITVLDAVYQYPSQVAQIKFLAHFIGGGKTDVETHRYLHRWAQRSHRRYAGKNRPVCRKLFSR